MKIFISAGDVSGDIHSAEIIKRVRENKTTLREFTAKFENAFFEDLAALNCLKPNQTPRATEHIPAIISLIEKLVARGIAYKANDGSVYFSIEKYRGCGCKYGQLVNLNFDGMRAGERVRSKKKKKESIADFALWKAAKENEPYWRLGRNAANLLRVWNVCHTRTTFAIC